MTDVYETKDQAGRRNAIVVSEACYWNQYDQLVGRGRGWWRMVPLAKQGETLLYNREIYVYSEEEIEQIRLGIEGEVLRGSTPLYWDDVQIGDDLTPVVKGPFEPTEIGAWHGATQRIFPMREIAYRKAKMFPGLRRLNPETNWPFFLANTEMNDHETCILNGMPHPFDADAQRLGLASHLLSNWAGDGGWVRQIRIENREPFLYGDTIWFKGAIMDKYKIKVAGGMYRAVDVRIDGVNLPGLDDVAFRVDESG